MNDIAWAPLTPLETAASVPEVAQVAATGDFLVPVYVVYAVISVALTVWLARTLAKNGAVFLQDVFEDKPALADAVNRLLVVGFYLVNLGYAALIMRADAAGTIVGAIETLAFKLGLLLMSLAGMHFLNMYVFHRIRRRARGDDDAPKGAPYRVQYAGAGYGGSYYQAMPQPPAAEDGESHSAFEMIRRKESELRSPESE
jgi:hypothetical protein